MKILKYTNKQIPISFLLVLILAVSSCAVKTTLDYRDIQADYNRSIQNNNVLSFDPLGQEADNQQKFTQIQEKLSDEFINGLSPELRQNAYLILAVSQWRTGKLIEAKVTAQKGLREGVVSHPRDRMMLEMIPVLVNEQDLFNRFGALNYADSSVWNGEVYENIYGRDYGNTTQQLEEIIVKYSNQENIPDEMIYYAHFQRWRILNNWDGVILKLWAGSTYPDDMFTDESIELRDRAMLEVSVQIGNSLDEEIEKEKNAIPAESDLSSLINTLE